MSESQNGWLALDASSPKLNSWLIPGTDRRIRLRNGSAGFLLIHLALWFEQKIEDVDRGILDDWGYAYRPVRGYESGLSNHSSGTAMDLNATQHGLGAVNTFTFAEEEKIQKRVDKFFDNTIRWGGEYKGRKDEMHWEIDCPLSEAEKKARELCRTPRGRLILDANPGQKKVIFS